MVQRMVPAEQLAPGRLDLMAIEPAVEQGSWTDCTLFGISWGRGLRPRRLRSRSLPMSHYQRSRRVWFRPWIIGLS